MRSLLPFRIVGSVLIWMILPVMPAFASAAVAQVISAADARLQWMGRTQPDDSDNLQLGYPGVTLRFVYSGPAPVLRLRAATEDCYFNLAVNGWSSAVLRLAKGENEILIPAGDAPDSGWLVTLVRRTEAWQGIVTFEGLELPHDSTRLLPFPAAPTRRLLVIGDSITTGHYVEQLPGTGDPTPRTNNAERTWGWRLAQALDAQINIVAYGGRGLTRTWDGRTDLATAPQFFERALPDNPAALWDHRRYQPDVIVIMLGQNDFNLGIVPADEFVAAYNHFIARLRSVHPDAAIVLTGSPMQGTEPGSTEASKRAALYADLDRVAADARTGDWDRIAVVRTSHQPGTALNAHPVVFQQDQIALELESAVRALAGW